MNAAVGVCTRSGQLVLMPVNYAGLQHKHACAGGGGLTTSLASRLRFCALKDAVGGGGKGLRVLGLRGATPYYGGVPIFVDGKIMVRSAFRACFSNRMDTSPMLLPAG